MVFPRPHLRISQQIRGYFLSRRRNRYSPPRCFIQDLKSVYSIYENEEDGARIFIRLWSPGINSASLCSLAGRYDKTIPPRFHKAPIDSLKIPARFSLQQ